MIAAITSCTNTSNPGVLVAAGLVAKKADELGLKPKPWVKTSLAPGSQVVTDYLEKAGLQPHLDNIGFNLVGYGCTTCIGNSGPLAEPISKAINENGLVAAAVISGNRNFEGRVHTQVRANYLASPPLVVAYAIAGTVAGMIVGVTQGYERKLEINGVGFPYASMLRKMTGPGYVIPIITTNSADDAPYTDQGKPRMPRMAGLDLFRIMIQLQRFMIARGAKGAALLVDEMKTFIQSGKRPEAAAGSHDDLVLAGAHTVWAGARLIPPTARAKRFH